MTENYEERDIDPRIGEGKHIADDLETAYRAAYDRFVGPVQFRHASNFDAYHRAALLAVNKERIEREMEKDARLAELEARIKELEGHLREFVALQNAPHRQAPISDQVDSGYIDAWHTWDERTKELLK